MRYFLLILAASLTLSLTGCGVASRSHYDPYYNNQTDYRGSSSQYNGNRSKNMAPRVIGEYMDAKAAAIAGHSRDADVRVVTDRKGIPALQITYNASALVSSYNGTISNRGERELDYICRLMSDEKHTDVSIVAGTRSSDRSNVLAGVNIIKNYLVKRGIAKSRIVETDAVRGGGVLTDTYTITFMADNNMVRRANNGAL